MAAKTERPQIIAYVVDRIPDPIETAPASREWMESSPQRFALRCLPLSIANASGWLLLNQNDFAAEWNGGVAPTDVKVTQLWDPATATRAAQTQFVVSSTGAVVGGDARGESIDPFPYPAVSGHFGCGVLTFRVGYLFRTPPGVNLWVKGPPNEPKDGIAPLEGIIETDWSPSTFTMNWKFTRPSRVEFRKDEPIAFFHPIPRAYVEGFSGVVRSIHADERELADYNAWRESRSNFLSRLSSNEEVAVRERWQKDYFKGEAASTHQTKVTLSDFIDERNVPRT